MCSSVLCTVKVASVGPARQPRTLLCPLLALAGSWLAGLSLKLEASHPDPTQSRGLQLLDQTIDNVGDFFYVSSYPSLLPVIWRRSEKTLRFFTSFSCVKNVNETFFLKISV